MRYDWAREIPDRHWHGRRGEIMVRARSPRRTRAGSDPSHGRYQAERGSATACDRRSTTRCRSSEAAFSDDWSLVPGVIGPQGDLGAEQAFAASQCDTSFVGKLSREDRGGLIAAELVRLPGPEVHDVAIAAGSGGLS